MAIQERALHTRKVILEAAAELFNELGYEATTIAALIDRLPVTRGGVYFHFTSKASLAEGVLAEAVTTEGVVEQQFKLQEWADLGLLLAHRMPAEPMLRASIRLAVDPNARRLFGTRWPDWIRLGEGLLTEAKERGELLPHVVPAETARLLVGAWTGVQLVTESLPGRGLPQEVSNLYALILPSIAAPGVLARLEVSPFRAERLLAGARARAVG
ncbi:MULTISPECIES: ScbR family autoregulator-binding transcription factor [unclassified Streptomyces]|uniref:ScbR family autoregulator-binding transcription factor n=1 Tax=Streptomyces sp. NPDC088180 TaxID=3365837 RepID=UPI0037FB88A2